MAAVLARLERAASPDFLTPLDVKALRSGQDDTWPDDAREPGSDGDDEQVMQHLRAARERLLSLGDEPVGAARDALEVRLRRPSAQRERAQSQPLPSPKHAEPDPRRHSTRPGSRDSLTLDLASVPFSAFIDAERRRLSGGLGAPGNFAASPRTPPSHNMSGSRYGLAPYMDLERDEWLWTTEGHSPRDASPVDGAPSPAAHEASQCASHALEAWTWAMSGPPNEPCEDP